MCFSSINELFKKQVKKLKNPCQREMVDQLLVSALETQMQEFKLKQKKGRGCFTFVNRDPTSFKIRPGLIYWVHMRDVMSNAALTVVDTTQSFYITTLTQPRIAAVQQFSAACIIQESQFEEKGQEGRTYLNLNFLSKQKV